MNSARQRVGDKYFLIFKTLQKMVTKLRQFTKLGPFSTLQLFKLSQLCYLFLQSFKSENIFLKYPQLYPALCCLEFIGESILPKKFSFCIFKKKKQKKHDKFVRDPPLHISFALFLLLLKISRNFNLFGKNDLSMNLGQQRPRDSQAIKKLYFHFQNSIKNGNKVGIILKA